MVRKTYIVNFQLKTNERRGRRHNVSIFVVSSNLIVGRWLLVAWSRKSCLGTAGNVSFVFLALFKDGGAGWVEGWETQVHHLVHPL